MTSKKALICFHGSGSKGSVFKVQMARLYTQLSSTFDMIFLDGPLPSPAGPGVLPLFEGHEPYYGWFGGYDSNIDDSMRQINQAVQKGVENWKAGDQAADVVNIVGGIGFSEGGLALAFLLWVQQEQRQWEQDRKRESTLLSTIPPLQFAIINCCFFPREASLWVDGRAQSHGEEKAFIDVPTLHVHGNRDFCLGRARQLVRNHYRPQFSTVLNVDTSHHMASQKDDVAAIVRHTHRLAGVEET